jgi:hypothetical protein
MKKIKYRIVYNRKKRLDSQGKALVQVEAYLLGKKAYFSTHTSNPQLSSSASFLRLNVLSSLN